MRPRAAATSASVTPDEGAQPRRRQRLTAMEAAVGLSIVWQDEHGAELERLDEPGFDPRILSLDGVSRTTCVRFVDPHGDTVFNQLQLPALGADLRELAAAVPDAEVRSLAAAVAHFLERCNGARRTYVRILAPQTGA